MNINKKASREKERRSVKRISTRKSSLHVKWINLNPFLKKTNGEKT